MSRQKSQTMRSVEIALDHALSPLKQLKGLDKLAFENEYKEWLTVEEITEQVWFFITPNKDSTG